MSIFSDAKAKEEPITIIGSKSKFRRMKEIMDRLHARLCLLYPKEFKPVP